VTLRIVTDSTADLPLAVTRQFAITVVPVSVLFGDEELRDGIDITSEQFFRRLPRAPQLPTTSQPAPGMFREAYLQLIAEGATEILSIHVSGKLSGTIESARQAASAVRGAHIEILDSGFVSGGLGLAVLSAAAAAQSGRSLAGVVELVREQLTRTHLFFVLDTLEFLRRGGRIGRAAEMLGTLIRLKPILEVKNGEVLPAARARTRRRAVEELLDMVSALRPLEQSAVFHAAGPDDLEYVTARLQGFAPGARVLVGELGPAVGAHTGPGTIGVVVVTEQHSPPSRAP
jgi:DegV family protein with EDD domain